MANWSPGKQGSGGREVERGGIRSKEEAKREVSRVNCPTYDLRYCLTLGFVLLLFKMTC